MAKQKLVIQQRVWIESSKWVFRDGNPSVSILEHEVVRANNSSAYLVSVEDLNKESSYELRVSQSDLKVMSTSIFGTKRTVWLSLEEREAYMNSMNEKKRLRDLLHTEIDNMNLETLEELASQLNLK